MTGTFGGALEARGVPAGEGYLTSQARGEIFKDDKVLLVRRIHVTYRLKISPAQREIAERVLGFHADYCPVARTIRNCVEISTALEMENI
ncbi:MAG: OsmC family protein [Anaerolineales bacterium]|nr:MAG: OsmC family protein [Anaerolineales bacterium]